MRTSAPRTIRASGIVALEIPVYHTDRRTFSLFESNAHTAVFTPSHRRITTPLWLTAVRAAESKKALDIRVLDLREVTSFADFFVICSGSNPKQIQAISEEIGQELEKRGEYPVSVEGFANAEWILADFGDYLIHVFSPKARAFYELERLWRHAKVVEIPEDSRAFS